MVVIHRASGILLLMMSIFRKNLGSTAAATTVVTALFLDQPDTTGIGAEFFWQESPMANSFRSTVQRVLSRYERGITTSQEIAHWVYPFAIRPSFLSIIKTFPSPVLKQLQRFSRNARSHPEDIDIFILQGWCGGVSKFEPEVERRIDKNTKYWAFLRLREYFEYLPFLSSRSERLEQSTDHLRFTSPLFYWGGPFFIGMGGSGGISLGNTQSIL